ncbi:MAG: carboxypeptidase-like regulatory domain-containing protein [Pirellula sp.]|nr:carboxypeptidase-like regulatory domain-containing protein [Pirellula sp.]
MFRFLPVLAIVLLASCGGPKLTKVSGVVTFKGKPVENVTVQFAPDGEGVVGAATTDASGKYDIGSSLGWGVPPGSYTVKIKPQITAAAGASSNPMEGLAPGSPEYAEAYRKMASGAGRPNDQYKPAKSGDTIPEEYQNGKLKAMVQDVGSQTLDFKIE